MLKEVLLCSSKEIVSLNARISVMEKLRPQPRDKNREIDDRTESERGEVLWVVTSQGEFRIGREW